jgi:hypothetical protein
VGERIEKVLRKRFTTEVAEIGRREERRRGLSELERMRRGAEAEIR